MIRQNKRAFSATYKNFRLAKKMVAFGLIFLFALQSNFVFFIPGVQAHDSGVHREMTEKAIDIKIDKHGAESDFGKEMIEKKYRKKIEDGSEEEDYPDPLRSIPGTTPSKSVFISPFFGVVNFQNIPWLTHFYNPTTGRGLMGIFPAATDISNRYFEKAIEYYQGSWFTSQSKEKAYYVLGRAIHLVEDMSCPGRNNGEF